MPEAAAHRSGGGNARFVLRGGLVFDGTGSDPFRADVAIQGGRIVELGTDLEGETIDAAGRTVLPGLIDCHAHPAYTSGVSTLDDEVDLPASYVTLQALAGLKATLEAGVTTVRDAAGADAGLRRAIEDGLIIGPRLVISLMQLSPSAGPYDARSLSGLDTWVARPGIPNPVADGPEQLRAKVREFVQAGADVIKVFATGHFAMARDGARRTMFTDAELAAIVDEANRHGLRVMAHAHGSDGAIAAARAGVASIEHGMLLDASALDAMAEAGTVFVPTLMASAALSEKPIDDVSGGDAQDRSADSPSMAAQHQAVVRDAHRRGIEVAMGTDCPVTPHGRNDEELSLLVACGLTPAEALASGTSVAARLLGLEGEIGQVRPGLRADLLVLDGDPLDVRAFRERLVAVYRGGTLVAPDRRLS